MASPTVLPYTFVERLTKVELLEDPRSMAADSHVEDGAEAPSVEGTATSSNANLENYPAGEAAEVDSVSYP
jgi:hypothetical protein